MRETVESANANLAEDGRTLGTDATFEIVDVASGILESTDPAKADVRSALAGGQPKIAAGKLVSLAVSQTDDPTVSRKAAAETWREAGAILYSIDPAKSAEAYRSAASLSGGASNYSSLADQIEAELARRKTDDAAGARLISSEYNGPIKSYPEPIKKGDFTLIPSNCVSAGLTLICKFDFEVSGPSQRVEIEDIELLDDWARVFRPSQIVLGERTVTDSTSINAAVESGKNALTLTFNSVPGGSNYGLDMVVDRRWPFRWRNLPTSNLSTWLRDQWGGPMGAAMFMPMNEELERPPYGLRISGCERFGRRLSCFGDLGYEGPTQHVELKDVSLVTSNGLVHRPSFMRLNTEANSNSRSLSTSIETGVYDFEIGFYNVPLYSAYKLSGIIGDTPRFEFASFKLGTGDESAPERLSAFYTWPPRVEIGSSIRIGDFKVSPQSCARSEYKAKCEIKLIYVGAPKQIEISEINLVDHMNNYYRPSKITLNGRDVSNSSSISTRLDADQYTLVVWFDSVPKSRLYELQAELDGRDELAIVNISLPAADGSLGVPTDIVFRENDESVVFENIRTTARGCSKRSLALVCYLEVDYNGVAGMLTFDDAFLTTNSGSKIKPTFMRLAGRSVRYSDDISTNISAGIYPMYVEFSDIPDGTSYAMQMNVNKLGDFTWSFESEQ
ncbi:hypothetical protein [Hyphomonas oceanitis]|uniref:hypothetical protein n=1 Tax=Hyphomonas oceanitis TaxID=81033 RepID=UPI00300389CD